MVFTVRPGEPGLPSIVFSYHAEPGRLSSIMIKQRPFIPVVRCLHMKHGFIHLLQHLQGNIRGVPPLDGSYLHSDPIPQET